MKISKDRIVTATVILRSESGKDFGPHTIITSENLAEFSSSPKVVEQASGYFLKMGFVVGVYVGISFSISGTVKSFESLFNIRLEDMGEEGIRFINKDGKPEMELPSANIPWAVKDMVRTITFAKPDRLGPPELFDRGGK